MIMMGTATTVQFWCKSVQWGLLQSRWNITPLCLFWLSCPVFFFRARAEVEPLK